MRQAFVVVCPFSFYSPDIYTTHVNITVNCLENFFKFKRAVHRY